jgi:hypothetical protein
MTSCVPSLVRGTLIAICVFTFPCSLSYDITNRHLQEEPIREWDNRRCSICATCGRNCFSQARKLQTTGNDPPTQNGSRQGVARKQTFETPCDSSARKATAIECRTRRVPFVQGGNTGCHVQDGKYDSSVALSFASTANSHDEYGRIPSSSGCVLNRAVHILCIFMFHRDYIKKVININLPATENSVLIASMRITEYVLMTSIITRSVKTDQ